MTEEDKIHNSLVACIDTLFHIGYTVEGIRQLMHTYPARNRDPDAVITLEEINDIIANNEQNDGIDENI